MKGAGIGTNLPRQSRVCPRSYGVVADTAFADYMEVSAKDVDNDKFKGIQLARSQILWKINIGDLIPDSGKLVVSTDLYCKSWSRDLTSNVKCSIPFIAAASVMRDRALRRADSEKGASFIP